VPVPPRPPAVPENGAGTGAEHATRTTGEIRGSEHTFEPKTLFQRSIGVSSSSIDDETVVADSLANRFFRLNSSASFIWKNIGAGTAFPTITAAFQREYNVDEATAIEVVGLFITDLVEAGLVVFSTSAEGEVLHVTNEKDTVQRSQ